jgi:hypothetical protein
MSSSNARPSTSPSEHSRFGASDLRAVNAGDAFKTVDDGGSRTNRTEIGV